MRKLKIISFILQISSISLSVNAQINDSIVDLRDGSVYKTIKIGDQWWMAENLVYTGSENSIAPLLIKDNIEWSEINTPAYCWYNDDEKTYRDTYGALYNWYAINRICLCPDGWHFPSDQEWKQLELTLGLSQSEADKTGIRGNNEGGQLKSNDTTYWNNPNIGATNKSGFSALPGGHRNWKTGVFIDKGLYGTWWSSSEADSNYAWRRTLHYNDAKIRRFTSHKRDGFSVRCVKD